MKILFLMDSPEYLRFFDTVIEELADRGHHVSLAVLWGREKKRVGLEGLRSHIRNVDVVGVVPLGDGVWADIGRGLRGVMDFVRYLHPRFAVAPALRDRMKRKALPVAYWWLDAIPKLSPLTVQRIERALTTAERAIPLNPPIVECLRRHAPDVLLASPLVASASPQVDWIKAAQACGIRTAVCVASWDNLTNKGLLRVQPDTVIVWNEAQKREAEEYHYTEADRVVVTGAQVFDRWFTKEVTRDREAFCARVGLPDTRPFLLFTGSSVSISRSEIEVPFVRRWIEAVRSSSDPTLRHINILIRPHPYNFHAWVDNPVADFPGVALFPRHGHNMIDESSRVDFYDSLSHCAAVIGVNTSAMIEAAIVGKPVFSMLSDEFSKTQEGTIHFHHLLPENGGFLRIASDLTGHVQQLSAQLADVQGARAELSRFVSSFIRPHGLDRPATPIFADAVEALGSKPRAAAESMPVWAPLVWPVLFAAGLLQIVVAWMKRWPLVKIARRVGKATSRARKAVVRTVKIAGGRVARRARLTGKQAHKVIVKPLRMRR